MLIEKLPGWRRLRCFWVASAGIGAEQEAAALQVLQAPSQQEGAKAALCRWQKRSEGEGLQLVHQHPISHVTWHARGDYFASVAPTGNTQVMAATHLCTSRRCPAAPFSGAKP